MREGLSEATTKAPQLDINYEKTCDCKSSHINCLTAKQWLKCQMGVWEFYYEGRDIRNKEVHPAVFPISMATKVISLFTHKGELVIDPFVGSGTTLVAARDLDRNAVGFDMNEEYIDVCKERLFQLALGNNSKQLAIADDARSIPNYFRKETVSLIFTSPPYANLLNRKRKNKSRRGGERKNEQYMEIEQYSQDPRDLGTLDPDDFSKAIEKIFANMLPLLRPKAHCVINVPDF